MDYSTLINDFKQNGAIVLRGVFNDWIPNLKKGIDSLIENPSSRERSYKPDDGTAPFFQDLCNWKRIEEFENFITNSEMAKIASVLMESKYARFFHDHVLVKEPGSSIVTPWHQDQPYYCVEGKKNVSFWIPLDKIDSKVCLKCISGSHLWGKIHKPKRFNGEDLYENDKSDEMPDIDKNINLYDVLSWELEPGDAIAFNFRVIHGADANLNNLARRRVFSARWIGDDGYFVDRKGKGSPPFEHLNLKTGDALNIPDFPIIYLNDNRK